MIPVESTNVKMWKVNDKVDALDVDNAAWFEAVITKITPNKIVVQFEGYEETAELEYKEVRPQATDAIKSVGELKVSEVYSCNYNFDDPTDVGFWYDVKILAVDKEKNRTQAAFVHKKDAETQWIDFEEEKFFIIKKGFLSQKEQEAELAKQKKVEPVKEVKSQGVKRKYDNVQELNGKPSPQVLEALEQGKKRKVNLALYKGKEVEFVKTVALKNKEIYAKVKWANQEQMEDIPSAVLREIAPGKLLDFYESRLAFIE
eukprot:Colp12_sorted_trinity150504_noHs@7427